MMKNGRLTKKEIKELQKKLPELPESDKIYIYECNECFCNWESSEKYGIQTHCPRCMSGDLSILEPVMKDDE